MRATVMYGAGDVRVENVPDPDLTEATDAVIRVSRACVCGSDLWPYKTMERSESGRLMGHEAIGIVEEVGSEVRNLRVGDPVVMPFAYSDGTCVFCHEGLHTACIHGGSSARVRSAEPRPKRSGSRRRAGLSSHCRSPKTTS
jgi:threonine dehydrogenase-like Zn-dependent dehydrogenase